MIVVYLLLKKGLLAYIPELLNVSDECKLKIQLKYNTET